jgi:hypothetical protein
MVRYVALQQEIAAAKAKIGVQESTIERLVTAGRRDQVNSVVQLHDFTGMG